MDAQFLTATLVALLTVTGAVIVKLLDRGAAKATVKAQESSTVITTALEVAIGMKTLADARTAEIERLGRSVKRLAEALDREEDTTRSLARELARLTGRTLDEVVDAAQADGHGTEGG